MSRVKLRNILIDGPISLRAPFYNFIYFLLFSLVFSSCIFLGFENNQYFMDLTNEHFAPKNIYAMLHIVVASVAVHSMFFFPYENYESKFLQVACIYPANLWLSLLSSASAIVVGATISWLLFGPLAHLPGFTKTDLVFLASLAAISWPLATFFLAALLLPKSYVDSNPYISIRFVKVLVRTFVFFFVTSAALNLYLVLS